jgi:hypothetical protein
MDVLGSSNDVGGLALEKHASIFACLLTMLVSCGSVPTQEKNLSVSQFEKLKAGCGIADARLEPMR